MSGFESEMVSDGAFWFSTSTPVCAFKKAERLFVTPLMARKSLMIIDQSSFSKTYWPAPARLPQPHKPRSLLPAHTSPASPMLSVCPALPATPLTYSCCPGATTNREYLTACPELPGGESCIAQSRESPALPFSVGHKVRA